MRVGKPISMRGFTLIELLVTIAVAIVLATIAVPGFQGLVQSNRLASDFNEIKSAVHYARSEAVALRRSVSVEFLHEGASPWSVQVSQGGVVLLAREGRSRQTSVVAPEIITFNSLGRSPGCSDGNCDIEISVGSLQSAIISILPSGRIEKKD